MKIISASMACFSDNINLLNQVAEKVLMKLGRYESGL